MLDAYEQQTKALPCQHEIPERGCSTYNWQMAVVRDLRAMLAAAPESPRPAKWESLTNLEGLKLAYNHHWINNLSLRDAFLQGIRDAEAAHGITKE